VHHQILPKRIFRTCEYTRTLIDVVKNASGHTQQSIRRGEKKGSSAAAYNMLTLASCLNQSRNESESQMTTMSDINK
jgi:hypothetical protein